MGPTEAISAFLSQAVAWCGTAVLQTSLVVLFSSYIIWTCCQAWFGPLAKLPGPVLARFSSIWRIRCAASGQAPVKFQALHEQYGSVVRVGPNHVAISDPTQIPFIYGISSKFNKSRFYDAFTPLKDGKSFQSIFSLQDQDSHRKLKRGVAQKYSLSSLLSLEPLVDRVTQRFTAALRTRLTISEDNVLDLGEWVQFYAFDVIGAITFSKTFGFIDDATDSRGVIKGLEGGLKYGAVIGQVPMLHPWLLGNPLWEKTLGAIPFIARKNPVPIVFKMIQESLSSSNTRDSDESCEDFATFLKKHNEKDSQKMSDTTITSHMFVNLLAGSDTTAISLRTIFYHLMRNPLVYTKLQNEIDTADRQGLLSPVITYAETQAHIPYMAFVVKEGLRIHPAVALTLERVVPEGGFQVHGDYIPEGTVVGVNPWVVHYDKDVFGDDVHVFRPERWSEQETGKGRLKKMESSFFAFGHGSRSCIGKNISLMEMGKFVPQFLREFSIEWLGEEEWMVESSWFAKQSGIRVRIRNRT